MTTGRPMFHDQETKYLCKDTGLPEGTLIGYWYYTEWARLDDMILGITDSAFKNDNIRYLLEVKISDATLERVVSPVQGSPEECVVVWYLHG